MSSCRHVSNALRALMKGVQENGEVDEEELDDVVRSRLHFNFLLNPSCFM